MKALVLASLACISVLDSFRGRRFFGGAAFAGFRAAAADAVDAAEAALPMPKSGEVGRLFVPTLVLSNAKCLKI